MRSWNLQFRSFESDETLPAATPAALATTATSAATANVFFTKPSFVRAPIICSCHGRDEALRPARHRRADRGPVSLRARGRRLLRADRIEPRAHPRGSAFLPLRAPVGVASVACEAAQA